MTGDDQSRLLILWIMFAIICVAALLIGTATGNADLWEKALQGVVWISTLPWLLVALAKEAIWYLEACHHAKDPYQGRHWAA